MSCYLCNLHKGSDAAAFDPLTNQLIRLFNPRIDEWDEHFEHQKSQIEGKTVIGRATVRLLQMNSEEQLLLRRALVQARLYP